jgi:hypothetical protein
VIRLVATGKDGRQLLLLGIDNGNIKRLKKKMPIRVNVGEYLPDNDIDVLICWGRTMRELRNELSEFIGPETEQTYDIKALRDQDGDKEDKDRESKLRDFSTEELAEFVNGVKASEAKVVNDAGYEEQIKFLVDAGVRIIAHG